MLGQSEIPQDKIDAIHRGYGVLERYLGATTFLAANRMTLADLSVFAWMESITQVVTVAADRYPKIVAWLNTLRQLPYYEDANKSGADLHIKLFNDAVKRNREKL